MRMRRFGVAASAAWGSGLLVVGSGRRALRLEVINPTAANNFVSMSSMAPAARSTPGKHSDHFDELLESSGQASAAPSSVSFGSSQSSIDVSWKELREMFYDERGRRCMLCNEYIGSLSYSLHNTFAPHTAREGVALQLLQAFSGTPEEISDGWWTVLDSHKDFHDRRAAMSALIGAPPTMEAPTTAIIAAAGVHPQVYHRLASRRERVLALLTVLKRHGILHDCFAVVNATSGAHGRTWEFDRLEWVGDNVIKYVFSDRLTTLFPMSTGGVQGKLGYFTSMIDSNDGLARAYDFLNMSVLAGTDKIISKFKSDVIEAIFGELQAFLWKTEVLWGDEGFSFPLGTELQMLRGVVSHTIHELGHLLVMMHVEGVRAALEDLLAKRGIPLVRTDKRLKGLNAAQRSLAALMDRDFALTLASESRSAPASATAAVTKAANSRHFRVGTPGLHGVPVARPTTRDALVPRRLLSYLEWHAERRAPRCPLRLPQHTIPARNVLPNFLKLTSDRSQNEVLRPRQSSHAPPHAVDAGDSFDLWLQASETAAQFKEWVWTPSPSTRPPAMSYPALCALPRPAPHVDDDLRVYETPPAESVQSLLSSSSPQWDEDVVLAAAAFVVRWAPVADADVAIPALRTKHNLPSPSPSPRGRHERAHLGLTSHLGKGYVIAPSRDGGVTASSC